MPYDIERYHPGLGNRYEGRYQSRASREIARLKNDADVEGIRMAEQAKLDWLESEIAKAETHKAIDDADELINHAHYKAGGDPLKEIVYGSIVHDGWLQGTVARIRNRHNGMR